MYVSAFDLQENTIFLKFKHIIIIAILTLLASHTRTNKICDYMCGSLNYRYGSDMLLEPVLVLYFTT